MKAIQTEKLTKYYGHARGIIDVDLTVEEGDFFGFIGPNGAGKSTTIRTLLGLISPTGGRATVLGHDIVNEKTAILADVGYLPSEVYYYTGIKVGEVLEFSAKLRKTDCKKEAAALAERLELDLNKKVEQLSFGNRKKVGIVCALQHEPRLLILDEPTSGLDPLMQHEFYKILEERNREGTTVFLSSHMLSEVGRYCRSAAVIREGRILVSDRVEKLGGTGAKRVTLRGGSSLPEDENIRDLTRGENTVSFLYTGASKTLIAMLAGIGADDVTIREPDLEEVFMHFYEKEGK